MDKLLEKVARYCAHGKHLIGQKEREKLKEKVESFEASLTKCYLVSFDDGRTEDIKDIERMREIYQDVWNRKLYEKISEEHRKYSAFEVFCICETYHTLYIYYSDLEESYDYCCEKINILIEKNEGRAEKL